MSDISTHLQIRHGLGDLLGQSVLAKDLGELDRYLNSPTLTVEGLYSNYPVWPGPQDTQLSWTGNLKAGSLTVTLDGQPISLSTPAGGTCHVQLPWVGTGDHTLLVQAELGVPLLFNPITYYYVTKTVSVRFRVVDFDISVPSTCTKAVAGTSVNVPVAAIRGAGYDGAIAVNIPVSGSVQGLSCSPAIINANDSVGHLLLNVGANAPACTWTLPIEAEGVLPVGPAGHTKVRRDVSRPICIEIARKAVSLSVSNPEIHAVFTVTMHYNSHNNQGWTTVDPSEVTCSEAVTITALNGYSGTPQITSSPLPLGVTGDFDSQSSMLRTFTIKVPSSTKVGSTAVTLTPVTGTTDVDMTPAKFTLVVENRYKSVFI